MMVIHFFDHFAYIIIGIGEILEAVDRSSVHIVRALSNLCAAISYVYVVCG